MSTQTDQQHKIFYGWFIVSAVFLVMFTAYAIWYAFPVFYVPILNEFGWSRAQTASIISVGFVTYGVGSLIGGILLDRFGPRILFTFATMVLTLGLIGCSRATTLWQFYLFWGGFTAFGVSAVGFVPCNTLVSRWFIRKRATALGIAQAGGRESFLTTPLIQILIMSIGWRNTMLVLAGCGFVFITVIAKFLKHSPSDVGLLPDGDISVSVDEGPNQSIGDRFVVDKEWAAIDWTLAKGLKHYRLWVLSGVSFTLGLGVSVALTHQVAYIVDIGFTALFASFLILLFGIFSVAGRFSGFISDKIGREPTFLLGTLGISTALIFLLLAENNPLLWMLYTYIVVFGFFSGLTGPTYISGGADIFQGKHLGSILGFTNIGYGFGNAFGAWLGGYIFDTLGSYGMAFIVAMMSSLLACVLYWITAPRKVRLVPGVANRKKRSIG